LHHLVECLDGVILVSVSPRRACIVDENVEFAIAVADTRNQSLAGVGIVDVRRYGLAIAIPTQLRRRLLTDIGGSRRDVHLGAGLKQALGHHVADAAGTACDQGHLAVE
jgi:hypothetical protein